MQSAMSRRLRQRLRPYSGHAEYKQIHHGHTGTYNCVQVCLQKLDLTFTGAREASVPDLTIKMEKAAHLMSIKSRRTISAVDCREIEEGCISKSRSRSIAEASCQVLQLARLA